MPTSRWSAARLLNWWENATKEEVYAAIDPILYSFKPAYIAEHAGYQIDSIYNLRKKCFREAGGKPAFVLVIRILSLK